MKFQVIQISTIVFFIFLFILFYFFLFTHFTKNVENILQERKVDIFDDLKNVFSSYLKLSLYYSVSKNLRNEYHTWIYNGFNPLDFNYLKECKENHTKMSLNSYISKFHVSIPVFITTSETEKCLWNLEERDVFSGKHDEAHFFVNCSDVSIFISSNDTFLFDNIEPKNFITNNRYWYLYRKIYEWAKENANSFVFCICNLVSSCYDCKLVEICYEELFHRLKEKFKEDEYIRIDYQKPCCYQEYGDPCIDRRECLFWTKNRCNLNSKYECFFNNSSDNISEKLHLYMEGENNSTSLFFSPLRKSSSFNEIPYVTCKWIENRMETSSIFRCEDYKYFESTPYGPDKIVFTIGVFAGFRFHKACIRKVICYYDSNSAICEECNKNEDFCNKCKLPLKNCEDIPCFTPPDFIKCRDCEVERIDDKKFKINKCKRCDQYDPRCS